MRPKPFAAACERNRVPILETLRAEFAGVSRVLEIGSGTGQHAAWFAPRLPELRWVASDVAEQLRGIAAWVEDAGADNLEGPVALDVTRRPWPDLGPVDAAFSANTAHIMPTDAVEAMFHGLGELLPPAAPFCLYGPFNVDGQYTGEGNRVFDCSLRAMDPAMGLRDLVWLQDLARDAGFLLEKAHRMPADNRILLWRRT